MSINDRKHHPAQINCVPHLMDSSWFQYSINLYIYICVYRYGDSGRRSKFYYHKTAVHQLKIKLTVWSLRRVMCAKPICYRNKEAHTQWKKKPVGNGRNHKTTISSSHRWVAFGSVSVSFVGGRERINGKNHLWLSFYRFTYQNTHSQVSISIRIRNRRGKKAKLW